MGGCRAQDLGTNTLISPNVGDVLVAGSSFEIKWVSLRGNSVTLVLIAGPATNLEEVVIIAADIDNTGSYIWNIPADLPPQDDYALRISYDSNPNNYNYSDRFPIVNNGAKSSSTATSASTPPTTTPVQSSERKSTNTTKPPSTSAPSQPSPTVEETSTTPAPASDRASTTSTTDTSASVQSTSDSEISSFSPASTSGTTQSSTPMASSGSKPPIGPIVGGVLGGVAVLVAINIFVIYWLVARKRQRTSAEDTVIGGQLDDSMSPSTDNQRWKDQSPKSATLVSSSGANGATGTNRWVSYGGIQDPQTI